MSKIRCKLKDLKTLSVKPGDTLFVTEKFSYPFLTTRIMNKAESIWERFFSAHENLVFLDIDNLSSGNGFVRTEKTQLLVCAQDEMIPEHITEISVKNSNILKKIILHDKIERLSLSKCKNLEHVEFPAKCPELAYISFTDCTNLKELILPEGLPEISEYCFEDCENLEKLILPSSLGWICEGAFRNCNKLHDLNIPEDCCVECEPKIDDEDIIHVKRKDLKNLEVKSGNLVMIEIPKWMNKYFGLPKYQKLNREWFDFCRRYPDLLFLDYYDLSERGKWTFYVIHKDDTVPEWTWKAIVFNGSTSSAKTIHLHEGIEAVDFKFGKEFEYIDFPELTYMFNFEGCKKLKKIDLGKNEKLYRLEKKCLKDCVALESIDLPPNPHMTIEDFAFQNCASLREIKFDESVYTYFNFAKNAFDGCDKDFADRMLAQFSKIHERTAVIQEKELKESQQRLAEFRKELEAKKKGGKK